MSIPWKVLNVAVWGALLCLGYGGRDDYDRGYGGRGYDYDVAVWVDELMAAALLCLGYGGRDDYDRGYGGRGYDRDYDDRDRYRRGWDDGTPATTHSVSCFVTYL